MEVDSVVLQAVDGTQTELQMDGGEILNPVLLNSTFCANVVLKVSPSVSHHRTSPTVPADVLNCSILPDILVYGIYPDVTICALTMSI